MPKTNWKNLAGSIPSRIEIAPKKWYEVVHVSDFKDPETVGETRFDPNQIALKTGMTPFQCYSTFLHEVLHAMSEEYNIALTENQVLKLERALAYRIKKGDVF